MKKLVLFDLDGVLLDSQDNMRRAWAVVLNRTGLAIPFDDYFSKIGRPFRDIMALLGVADAPAVEKIYMTASFDFLRQASFYPKVPEVLAYLEARGITLGVVTSKDGPRTSAILEQLPVRFATVQTPDSNHRGKPAPDHLLIAMADARTDPKDSIYVGDMTTDWEAAVRAGIDYLHAGWGYGSPISGTTHLSNIEQLPASLS